MNTKYTKKNISAVSSTIENIEDNDFDIFFYVVGWESRFTEIINHLGDSFDSKKNIVLSFEKNGTKGYNPKKKDDFISNLNKHIKIKAELYEFEYSKTKLNGFVDTINNLIFAELKSKGKPLKIGFEFSSCPRYHFLSVLSLCINKNYVCSFSLFYSEGEYDINENDETLNDFFSSYGEETIAIPYVGSTKEEEESVFVFALGFEAKFIIDEFIKQEPDYVAFLYAKPGYTREYEIKVEKEIERIVNYCELPEYKYTKYSAVAGDAIGAWKSLEESSYRHKKNMYVVHYIIGTKPHCLAMTLNGIVNDNVIVKYRYAKKYKKRDVKANGQFWRYDIINLRVVT